MPELGIFMPILGMSPRARTEDSKASILGALFSKTQQRVLALLFGQPERSYFTTELIRLVGAGSGAVQRELRKLVQSGLVSTTTVGAQKHYRANPDAPIFEELRSIIEKTIGPARILGDALAPYAKRIALALLFGSVAKGSDRASSDIDVIIVSNELSLEESFRALGPAEKRLGRQVHPQIYTVTEFETRRRTPSSFVAKVLAGPHVILSGTLDDIASRQLGEDRRAQARAHR